MRILIKTWSKRLPLPDDASWKIINSTRIRLGTLWRFVEVFGIYTDDPAVTSLVVILLIGKKKVKIEEIYVHPFDPTAAGHKLAKLIFEVLEKEARRMRKKSGGPILQEMFSSFTHRDLRRKTR